MEREKNEMVLPSCKKKVKIKSYLNVGEQRKLSEALMSGKDINPDGGDEFKMSYDGMNKYQNTLIELAVISFDGLEERILERIEDLKDIEDFRALIDELTKLTKDEKKKKSTKTIGNS